MGNKGLTIDETNKLVREYFAKESNDIRSKFKELPKNIINETFVELSSYMALKLNEKICEKHLKDAILYAASMASKGLVKIAPAMSYYAIYHYLNEPQYKFICKDIDFDIDSKRFNNEYCFLYLLSEACFNDKCANYIFAKNIKIHNDEIEGWIYKVFYRAWKENYINSDFGYVAYMDIYKDKQGALVFMNMADVNKDSGYDRVEKIIRGMCI